MFCGAAMAAYGPYELGWSNLGEAMYLVSEGGRQWMSESKVLH
jgi:hypothetical protein